MAELAGGCVLVHAPGRPEAGEEARCLSVFCDAMAAISKLVEAMKAL